MLKIKQFVFNPFGECTYLLIDDTTRDAMVVDPGMFDASEQRQFDDYVAQHKLNIKGVINTHLHLDHCFGANYVKDKYGVPVAANVGDAELGASVAQQARKFGIGAAVSQSGVAIDAPLADGDTITIGNETLQVIATPGHTQGGICFYSKSAKTVLVGDTLFKGSIGRTDLKGGNTEQLVDNVNNKLLQGLPPDTLVLSGHGPSTSIAHERATNPFSWGA